MPKRETIWRVKQRTFLLACMRLFLALCSPGDSCSSYKSNLVCVLLLTWCLWGCGVKSPRLPLLRLCWCHFWARVYVTCSSFAALLNLSTAIPIRLVMHSHLWVAILLSLWHFSAAPHSDFHLEFHLKVNLMSRIFKGARLALSCVILSGLEERLWHPLFHRPWKCCWLPKQHSFSLCSAIQGNSQSLLQSESWRLCQTLVFCGILPHKFRGFTSSPLSGPTMLPFEKD